MTHEPGPIETLCLLCLQSERMDSDGEFALAVERVMGKMGMYESAPDLLAACKNATAVLRWYGLHYGNVGGAEYAIHQNEAAITAAEGKP